MKIAMIGQKTIGVKGGLAGGIETHVEMLATRLVDRGHQVFVYARKNYHQEGKTPVRASIPSGVHLVYVPTLYRKNLEAIIHTLFSTIHALFRNYDIIHYHGVGPATLSWIPRIFKPRSKVVVTFHSQDRYHQKWGLFARNYLHFGEWASAWFPNVCIAVSHVIQVYCRKVYHRQVVYIPNGAEPQHVRKTDQLEQFGLVKGEYFLNVGRVVKHKGLHYLIDAYQMLDPNKLGKKSSKKISQGTCSRSKKKLVIVGSPASGQEQYFEELKKRVVGDQNILFLGFQSGEPLRQLFAHAYLYIQPSESEGLAVVVLEAMSYGTAVLVSDIPENLEAIDHVGMRFKNKSVKSLAKQLQSAEDDPKMIKQVASDLKIWMKANFSWEVITDHVEEVYRSVRH
ncbi:MAG: glycosyltransferase family 4 protein [Candidatus Uhrbacteria bacterium]